MSLGEWYPTFRHIPSLSRSNSPRIHSVRIGPLDAETENYAITQTHGAITQEIWWSDITVVITWYLASDTVLLVAAVRLLGALCRCWSQNPGCLFAVSVWHSALFYTPAVSLIEFTSVETSSREILRASNWLDGRFLCRGPEAVIFTFLATLDSWQQQSSVADSNGNMNIILLTCL